MTKRAAVTASIKPSEVVFGAVSLFIRSARALDPEAAQSGIVVRGLRGQVRLSQQGRMATWTPDAPLQPGNYALLVRGLLTSKGEPIHDELIIPFFVTDSRAKISPNLSVESMARLRVNEQNFERLPSDRRPAGKYVEVFKATDRKSGRPVELAFDEAGEAVKAQRLYQQVLENRVRKFGKVHEHLHARLETAEPETRVPVALWLRAPEALEVGDKKERGVMERPTRTAVARQKAITGVARDYARRLEKQYDGRGFWPDLAAPVVYAELSREELQAIVKDPNVVAAFLHETEGIEDLDDSISIANSDDVHALGFKGSGVKVAVWEDGPDVTTNLTIAARYKTSGFATSEHSRHTHGIVKNKERNKPHGHAPSSSLHSANSKDLDAIRWAAQEKGCTVISQSFHRSSEPGSSTMSYDDIYKDWLALQWPYPTICQAAGNFWQGDSDNIQPPSSEYVNHKGFNGLTVGNHDDSANAMSGTSVFRNPASAHGDRELPEIAANGTTVTTVGLTKSGTSMAAPAAAGCAVLIQQVDTTLKSWPEGCRAILLAGAKRNVVANTWWQDVLANQDASDGTGAVDALESVNIAKQRRSRNATATGRGWDVGTLRTSDIGRNRQTTFAYSVKLSPTLFAPRHVKVALAWDSKISSFSIFGTEFLLGSSLTVDLDLQIFDSRGNQVGYSGSWDNSYEIAEFDGKPGETYTIKIRRWSGTDDVWYGIAWTVTGGLFWADVTRFTTLQRALASRGSG